MKNPNSLYNRAKTFLLNRWLGEDYPSAEPRFQVSKLAEDIAVYILLPVFSIVIFKSCEIAVDGPKRNQRAKQEGKIGKIEGARSQIIEFSKSGQSSEASLYQKRAPGTVVRLKLLNSVETYATAPVQAQIIDGALGRSLVGGIIVGDATPDSNFERINISFKFARDPYRAGVAVPISARALSLNGSLGVVAFKKEGFVTRATLASTGATNQDSQEKDSNDLDLKKIIIRALTAGLAQEIGSTTQVEKNRSQVLTISPGTEFFAELTDYFPGNNK